MNGAIAGIDNTPATFGPRFAHGGTRVWHLVSCAERVRRAVEPIRCGNRTDFDRLKQNIVTGISSHAFLFSLVIVVCRGSSLNVSPRFELRQVGGQSLGTIITDKLATQLPGIEQMWWQKNEN